MGKGKVRILDSVQSSLLTNMANKLERTWRSEEGSFGTWKDVSEDKIVKFAKRGWFLKEPRNCTSRKPGVVGAMLRSKTVCAIRPAGDASVKSSILMACQLGAAKVVNGSA